jgi:hypothetical protein
MIRRATMLTVRQLVAIETQKIVPPLHVGDLRKKFGPGPLSLRSIIRQVGAKKTTLFVEVRDASILRSVTDLAQFQAAWRQSAPSKAMLVQFSQILSSTGASIVYLSRDWRTVGIAGAATSLAGSQYKVFDINTGLKDIAAGGGIAAGAALTILTASGPIGWGVIVFAVVAGGASGVFIGEGLAELFSDNPTTPAQPPIQLPEITLYGQLPPDVSEDSVIDLPALDPDYIQMLPDVPPDDGGDGGGSGPG